MTYWGAEMKKRLNILSTLELATGVKSENILKIIAQYKGKYKKFYIPKKNGGTRTIYHPAQQLKMLQYAIDINVIQKLPVSTIAKAYIKNLKSPLRSIALEHTKYKYTVRIDFKDFFPSLHPKDIYPPINNIYHVEDYEFDIISKILFRNTPHGLILPIGAPSSPNVSNAIMYDFDNIFMSTCINIDKQGSVSRYADDLYFSTNIQGACLKFYEQILDYCKKIETPHLEINTEKLLFLSRGNRRIVCGLTIASQGSVSIGRDRKIKIKKMLYNMSRGFLKSEEIQSLRGTMAFIKDVEPEYYNKLIIKYGCVPLP